MVALHDLIYKIWLLHLIFADIEPTIILHTLYAYIVHRLQSTEGGKHYEFYMDVPQCSRLLVPDAVQTKRLRFT